MGGELAKQLFGQPRRSASRPALLGVMGLIPGMPNLAFLSMAALCGWRRVAASSRSAIEAAAGRDCAGAAAAAAVAGSAGADLGRRAARSTSSASKSATASCRWSTQPRAAICWRASAACAASSRRSSASSCRPCTSATTSNCGPNAYRINLAGVPVGEGVVHPERELAINPGRVFGQLTGIETRDPAFGMEAVWIEPSAARARAVARLHGGRCEHRDRHAPEPPHPDARARAVRSRRSRSSC